MRFCFIAMCLLIGGIVAYFGQPYTHNADLILILVTVFTVFAGFLVAIIAILGDPSFIPDGLWRLAEARRDNIESRLIWHSWLFMAYLVTIALLFVGVLLRDSQFFKDHEVIRIWIERAYLFVGVSSFLFTFALPWALMNLQRARVDAEIERRRREAGIGAANGSEPS
jgi:hypothetical protein